MNPGCCPASEIQFETELKLPLIKCCRRAAAVASVAGAIGDGIHIFEPRRYRSLIKSIEEVESFSDYLKPETLAEEDISRDSQVKRRV